MDKFLGFENLIARTHEFFPRSLIYYNGRPDLMKVVNGHVMTHNTGMTPCAGKASGGDLKVSDRKDGV